MKYTLKIMRYLFFYLLYFLPTAAVADVPTTLTDVQQAIRRVQNAGYGFLESIFNSTKYPCDLYFIQDRPEDFLPDQTIIRIKSNAEKKYFSYRQQPDNTSSFKADSDDLKDPATLFIVRRRISPDLTPRISISPINDPTIFLTYDPDSVVLAFTKTDYLPEQNKQCHWEMVTPYINAPAKMDKISLQNRLAQGCLTTYRGQATFKIEKDKIREDLPTSAWCLALTDNNIAFGDDVQIKSNRNGYRQYYLINTGPGENTFGTEDKNDDNTVWQFVPWKNEPPKDSAYVSFGDAVALGHVKTKRIWNVTTDRHGWDSENRSKWELRETSDTLNSRNWDNTKDWWQDFAILDYNESDSGKRIVHDADLITTRFYNPFNHGHTCYPVFYASNVNELRSEVSSSWGGDGGKYQVIQKQPGALVTQYTLNADRTFGNVNRIQSRRDQTFIQISGRNDTDIWAVSKDGGLYHFDGQAWNEEKLGVFLLNVSIATDGTACCVDTNGTLRVKGQVGTWKIIPTTKKWFKVSVKNKDEIWGIDAQDKQVFKITEKDTLTPFPLTGTAIDISASSTGAIWAINADNQVSQLDGAAWSLVTGVKLTQVSVINNNDVFGIGIDNIAYHWDGSKLSPLMTKDSPKIVAIAVPTGTTKTVIPGKTEQRMVEGGSVVNAAGKPQLPGDYTSMAIEIETLGMGGGIKPMSMNDYVALPMKKKPKVAGFAETRLENIALGTTLQINPLLGKGAAWLETPLSTPGRITVSCMSLAGDAGGMEIIFGQDISTNFIWKVRIGGWNNAKSGIIKRMLVDNAPQERLVAQVIPSQDPTALSIPANPLASILPGQLTSYWVTIDNGLILVGAGAPGDNVFLSWRDPNPPDNVKYVGLGSDTKPVVYSNIELFQPIVTTPPIQTYTIKKDSFEPTATIDWSGPLFRTNNVGSLSCMIQGEEAVVIILGSDEKPSSKDYYQIVFGSGNNDGISLQKYFADNKTTKTIAFISAENYPDIKLDPTSPKPFWISYEYGQFMIGQGELGKNLLLCARDIAPFENIRSIGFATASEKAAKISSCTVASPVQFALGQAQSKDQPSLPLTTFTGNIAIIAPFEYEFSQVDQSVKMEDLVNHQSFYVAGTPRQGTRYSFILTMNKDGTPKLDPFGKADDPIYKEIQDYITKLNTEIQSKRKTAETLIKQAETEKKQYEKNAESKNKTAEIIGSTAQTVGLFAGGGLLTLAMMQEQRNYGMIAAGTTLTLGSIGAQAAVQGIMIDAGEKMFKGKEAEIAAQRKALNEVVDAERADAIAKFLAGQTQFSFRAADSYVFIDKANREALGSIQVDAETASNTQTVAAILAAMKPPTAKTFNAYISLLQKAILLITNLAVVAEQRTRQSIYGAIQTMIDSYKVFYPKEKPLSVHSQIINILLKAYNNTFLINASSANEAAIKNQWIAWINQFAAPSLTNKNLETSLEPMFGEYIWLPQKISGNTTITFQARTNNDIFVCFSPTNSPVRNTLTELYEVVIGGWDDTKSVVRLKSLDRSAKEVATENIVNALDYQDYWIMFAGGTIQVGTGKDPHDAATVFLSWKDPYPSITNPMKYIGISCWNAPLVVKNIAVNA